VLSYVEKGMEKGRITFLRLSAWRKKLRFNIESRYESPLNFAYCHERGFIWESLLVEWLPSVRNPSPR
jgi:hypothetical protein